VWIYLPVVVLLVLGVCGFVVLARGIARQLTRHTDRTAESMYENYGDDRGRAPPRRR
jgi:hypothetical protein